MRRSGGEPASLDSKNVLPVPVAEGCVLFKYDQQEPLSCFPEHLRKQQYFSLLRGFCFAAANSSNPTQLPPNGKFSPAQWEYHTFVVTIENGDRLYGHCLRFYDLQSHANATLAVQPAKLSIPDSIHSIQKSAKPLLNSAMLILSKFPLFDSLKKWLVHVCKEAYGAESESTSFSSIRIETRIINLVTEMVAIRSNFVATKLSLTSSLNSSGRVTQSGKRSVEIPFRIAHRSRVFPPLDFNLRFLFSCLDIHNILFLYEALLFGEQILVLSNHISLLSLACESLIALMFPMSWPFSYVPVFSNEIPIDYVGGLTPFLFGIVKSNPNILEPQAFLSQVNNRVIIVDLDQNKIFHQTKPQRLPLGIRQNLMDQVQRLLHPELSACDFAEAEVPVLDNQAVIAGIREAFFMVFVELFQGFDLKTTSALLEESSDSDQVKERKAYVSALASQSAAYQYFVDYVQPDNILLSVLKLPRESVPAAITAALKGPSNFLTFNEPEPQRLETKTRPDVTCWDARLFYQPRFEFLSSHVEKIIASQPDLTDLYVLRVHYLLADKRATQLVANLKELARVDPHNPLLECRDIFSTMFSQLSPDKVEALSREQDRVGDWARFFYLHERRRTSQDLSPESLAMFKYVNDTPDGSSPAFSDLVKKNLPALCCHKENMTLLMVAAAEWKLKMSYVLLKFNAASDFEGASGAAIHFFTSPRFKSRSEVQYLLLTRAIGMLIGRGDDIDRRDLYQFTGLLNLCQRASPSVPVIRFLLSNGADPNVFDAKGLSPMGSLLKGGQIDLAAAEAYSTLLEYGANVVALDRPMQELDAVAAFLGTAILRDPQQRLIALHNLASSKRDAYTRLLKTRQEEATKAPSSPKMSPASGSAASKIVITAPSGQASPAPLQNETHLAIKLKRLHSDAFATATYDICEAQFQHLIRLHLICHKYLEPLQRPDCRHVGRRERTAAEHLVSFYKPLRELLMTHNTLFGEIRKENAIYGSSSISRNVGTLFHPFLSTFNAFYPQFVSTLYETITPDVLQRELAATDTLKKWLDSVAVKQSRVTSDSFFMISSNGCSISRLLDDITDFPNQMHILFEDLLSKTDRGSDDYNLTYPLCNQLENLRNKISQMKQSTLSRKIQGLDPDSGAKGVLLHSGILSRVSLDAEDATEIRKQDLVPRQTFLFSLDIQKGYLVFCDEQTPAAINGNTSLVLRESYYLNELVPFDIPAFILPDGKESSTLCFQLVFVGHSSTSRHDSIILAAQTKDQKDKWLRLLWRLCIEGHAYSRNAGKYALYKRIGSSTTSFEGYLDYRTESMRVPWKCHYFVLSRQTLYAFQNSSERSEPILIIRLLEYELLTDTNSDADPASVQPSLAAGYKLISLRPHQFYQPKYLFRFSVVPRAMVKPDPASEWYSVMINFYDAHKMHSSAQANVSMAVGMAGLQPPPSPPMSPSQPLTPPTSPNSNNSAGKITAATSKISLTSVSESSQ